MPTYACPMCTNQVFSRNMRKKIICTKCGYKFDPREASVKHRMDENYPRGGKDYGQKKL